MTNRKVKIYPRFERIWHWSQMVLIVALLVTGMGLNGLHGLFPFKVAVMIHIIAALALLALWVFATFWLFTTGTWRQFIPRFEGLLKVARFYAFGIFKGEEHPYTKVLWRKHNPLQVIAYFGLKILVFPAIWSTGILYLTYNFWESAPDSGFWLEIIANLHLLAAYVILAFIIIHLYLLTVGHGFLAHVRPMITGFDEVELTSEQENYLTENEPWRLVDEGGEKDG